MVKSYFPTVESARNCHTDRFYFVDLILYDNCYNKKKYTFAISYRHSMSFTTFNNFTTLES